MADCLKQIEQSMECLNRIFYDLKKFFHENPKLQIKLKEFLERKEELIY